MKKLLRNMSTDEGRSFWEGAERTAALVESWPSWKRAGINVAQLRQEPRAQPPVDEDHNNIQNSGER